MTTIKVVELSGQGRDLGRAHGESLREQITEFCETIFEVYKAKLRPSIDRSDLIELSMKNAWILKRYSPSLYEEIEGIAEGANRSLSEVLLINSFLEIEDLISPQVSHKLLSPKMKGCTTFNVRSRASSNSIPILGQTYDMESYFGRYNTLLKIKAPDSRSFLIYSLAGVLGLNGLNSDGVALVINKLVGVDSREGVIYPFLVRQALSQKNISEALGSLLFAPRASSMCWQLSSQEGVSFCLETTAAKYAILPFRDSLAHTNHFLDPYLKNFEAEGWLTTGSTFVRLQVAQEYLDDFCGRIEVEGLKNLCQNHVSRPGSICCHASPDQPDYVTYQTISAVIIEPTNGIIHLSGPNPCQNVFQTISL
jgi:isopenicillin-N N-acyltransferase-like protein